MTTSSKITPTQSNSATVRNPLEKPDSKAGGPLSFSSHQSQTLKLWRTSWPASGCSTCALPVLGEGHRQDIGRDAQEAHPLWRRCAEKILQLLVWGESLFYAPPARLRTNSRPIVAQKNLRGVRRRLDRSKTVARRGGGWFCR